MVRPYDDAPDAEESVSVDSAIGQESPAPEEVVADAASQEGSSADAEPAEADAADVDSAGEPGPGGADADAASAGESEVADAAKSADHEPAPGRALDQVPDPEAAPAGEPAAPVPAAEPLDPIAAAAAAARAEAEKVRAAERDRAPRPASDPAVPHATAALPAQRPDRARPAAPGAVRPVAPHSARPAAYGTVEPARSRKSGGGRRGIAVALVVMLLFAAAGAGACLFFAGKPEPAAAPDRGQRVALTQPRAQQVLEGLGMEVPDLSQFRYVPTDNLVGPKFENVAIADAVERKEGDGVTVTREVTADALFRNKGILLTVPVRLTFAYDEAGETWREGDLELGDMTAQPLSAPNAADIVGDLDALLAAYDPAVGTLFAGVEAKTSSRLTTEGGSITVSMAKDEQVAEGDRQLVKHHSCTAQIAVSWSDTEGWVAKVDRLNDEVAVEDVTAGQAQQGAEGQEGDGADAAGQGGSRPEYGLKCSTGDLVELSGTVSGTPGALTFSPDGGLQLTLDGSQRDVWSMALKLGDGIDAGALVGRHVTVVGTISSGALSAEEVTVG